MKLQQIMNYKTPLIALVILSACGKPANDLDEKKKELESARNELISLREKIGTLEKEIIVLDPEFARNNNAILISTWQLEAKPFEHYVEVRGAVESRKNVSLSPTTGGKIEKVWVVEGQQVTAGQVLVSLESNILRNTVSELKTSLELANTVYEKQKKLWEQKIGSEIQYLQAKNNKESIEGKLATVNAQLDQMTIKAPFSGTIDRVDALVGEMAAPGMSLVRMVNPNDMYIKTDLSEGFIGKLKPNDKVEVYFPAFDKKVKSNILSIGQVINPENRTFRVETSFNSEVPAKPNQVVVISVRDYVNPKVFTVPTKLIQRDNEGTFVFVTEQKDNLLVARKVYVKPGLSYNGVTEVLEGLKGDEKVVNEGYREVTEGAELKVTSQSAEGFASK
ncbi:MAG: efflux RND transporter periplasmic adaptor subunit [Cyclobacteriaceae bacterium]|nr:efflux RND transporter periplasmic adaptor subunit [Cyclobacteriaceae bacterium]